jgi:hypothetical protein
MGGGRPDLSLLSHFGGNGPNGNGNGPNGGGNGHRPSWVSDMIGDIRDAHQQGLHGRQLAEEIVGAVFDNNEHMRQGILNAFEHNGYNTHGVPFQVVYDRIFDNAQSDSLGLNFDLNSDDANSQDSKKKKALALAAALFQQGLIDSDAANALKNLQGS